MQHHFNTDIAKQYGIVTAIMLDNFYFWISKNKANDKNFYNGRYWTYNTYEALAELFPYLSTRQVRYAIQKMIDNNLIMTDNFNPNKYDRTLYYAITDFGYSILQNCQMYNIYNITDTYTNTIKENITKESSTTDQPCTNEQKFDEQQTQPCKIKKSSKDILQEKEIIDYLNEKAKTRYTTCKSNTKFIAARLKEYSLEDLKSVIDCKCKEWKGTNMEMYLRPETLFNATKFENYYNQALLEKDKQVDCKVKEVSDGIFKI